MVPNTPTILDQLLGGIGLPQTGQAGSPGIGQSGESPFGDLLGLLMGGGTGEDALVDQAVARPLDLLGLPAAQEQVTAQAPLATTAMPLLIDSEMLVPTSQEQTSSQVLSGLPADGSETIDAGGKAATATDWPGKPFLAYPDLRSTLDSQQTTLTEGKFLVQDFRVTDGNLEMMVIPQDDPSSEPVKITVPMDALSVGAVSGTGLDPVMTEDASMMMRQASRVPLMPGTNTATASTTNPQSTQLTQLLAQVDSVDAKRADATAPNVQLRLAAENAGAPVVIDARTARANLTQVRESAVSTTGIATDDSPDAALLPKVDPTQVQDVAVRERTRPVAVPVNSNRQQQVFSIVENLAGGKDQPMADMSRLTVDPGIDKVGSTQDTSAMEAARPTVRMTVPETIERPTQSNQSQTVMLKIDPEHLGPARLHLTMRHDVLTARVMVDSSAARVAVEGSLDQLTDQLTRAGIDVDRIEVELSGGGAQDHQFEQQAQWSQARKMRSISSMNELNAESDIAQTIAQPVQPQYVGSGGVNLFA